MNRSAKRSRRQRGDGVVLASGWASSHDIRCLEIMGCNISKLPSLTEETEEVVTTPTVVNKYFSKEPAPVKKTSIAEKVKNFFRRVIPCLSFA
jgi:hypothetical protein